LTRAFYEGDQPREPDHVTVARGMALQAQGFANSGDQETAKILTDKATDILKKGTLPAGNTIVP
jgi:hypothetical protein